MSKLLSRLEPLVGMWDMAPVVDGAQVMRTTMEFAWIEDGTYLVQRSRSELLDTAPDVWKENAPTASTSVVGADEESFTVLYTDSRGVYRVYGMEFDGQRWTMHRRSPGFDQRFTGDLSEDGQTILGKWERSEDGGQTWLLDFDATLTRIR